MKMPPERALGQLTVFRGNCDHAPFVLCLSQQGACFPILLIIQPRVLEKTQGVNGKGWCLRAPDRNCYLARRWSLPSFQKETIAFFFSTSVRKLRMFVHSNLKCSYYSLLRHFSLNLSSVERYGFFSRAQLGVPYLPSVSLNTC